MNHMRLPRSLLRNRLFAVKDAQLPSLVYKFSTTQARFSHAKDPNYKVKTGRQPFRMRYPAIHLTAQEKLFRQCLLDCRNNMQSVPGMNGLVMRWTGGWVRDKLLGVPSVDIDVALSTMTGMQFGEALQTYMVEHGKQYEEEAEAQGFKANLKGLHKIAANPDKSKHLETITTKMFGIDVDFVNLRKEVYADDSRNPQMEFGTAEEDAMRRDATVNALFFNLDTQDVEDFTHQGFDDMEQKIIRTPLAPYQTFKDDPLRVLRLIRFACRLGYRIESHVGEAMKDKSIHEALRLKISRERVGVEVGKIFAGPDPYIGLKLINSFDLYESVFANPASSGVSSHNSGMAERSYESLRWILMDNRQISTALKLEDDIAVAWYLAAYVPWHEDAETAKAAAREGIKATNVWCKVLEDSIKNRAAIQGALSLVHTDKATRGAIGMIMRACKDTWRFQVLYSLLCDMTQTGAYEKVAEYEEFLTYLREQKLEDATSMDKKVVLNGNEIKSALGVAKAGPWLTTAKEMVIEWQFDNENTATKETASEMIRSRRQELALE
jgi:tRNA nucleotidyltransferase (CCA-adding enzyme)